VSQTSAAAAVSLRQNLQPQDLVVPPYPPNPTLSMRVYVCMCAYLHLSLSLSLRLWRPSTLDHGAADCFVVYLSTDEKAISDNKQDITSAESMRLFAMLAIVSNGHWSSDGVLGSTNLTFQHPILHRRTTTKTTTTTTPPPPLLLLLLLYYLLTTSPTAAAGLGDGRRED